LQLTWTLPNAPFLSLGLKKTEQNKENRNNVLSTKCTTQTIRSVVTNEWDVIDQHT
jgi:hypothetical protein